ncbi:hypothetical protein HK097_008678 [Rhizophlyctis rosea]|uniref:MFS general substrate transporter n=1 Tax=Rhizophlyctis rosea TaxID=64517 RepID=A0AAD5SC60_9FUNG|nr:hypothetical protein HK097_008678 [Rhizophlyctis rosea]
MARTLIPGTTTPGYYAGLLQSAYYLPTTFMNAVWGRLSDTIGRKPILLTGLCGYGFGVFTLGLGTAYWTALLSLCLTGAFSGNAVVAKGMIGELATDEESRAWAYSAYGVVFSAAGIMGTLLGGLLGNQETFSGIQFLRERPYFVACALGTTLAVLGVIITMKGLGETNDHGRETKYAPVATDGSSVEMTHVGDKKRGSWTAPDDEVDEDVGGAPLSVISSEIPDPPTEHYPTHASSSSHPSTFLPRPIQKLLTALEPYYAIISMRTIIPIFLYCAYALGNSLFHSAMPLLASAEPIYGGFGLSPSRTSFVMTSLSTAKLIFKALYSPIHLKLGTLWCFRIGTALLIPAAFLGPVLGAWYGSSPSSINLDVDKETIAAPWIGFLYASAICTGVGEGLMYLSTIMFLTNSVGHENYGLIHGVGGCLAAVVRTLGPTTAGAVWELGKVTGKPWLVFGLCSAVAGAGLVLSRWINVPQGRREVG